MLTRMRSSYSSSYVNASSSKIELEIQKTRRSRPGVVIEYSVRTFLE